MASTRSLARLWPVLIQCGPSIGSRHPGRPNPQEKPQSLPRVVPLIVSRAITSRQSARHGQLKRARSKGSLCVVVLISQPHAKINCRCIYRQFAIKRAYGECQCTLHTLSRAVEFSSSRCHVRTYGYYIATIPLNIRDIFSCYSYNNYNSIYIFLDLELDARQNCRSRCNWNCICDMICRECADILQN